MNEAVSITRVMNGWIIQPFNHDSRTYTDPKMVQVASSLDELVGIVLRWGEKFLYVAEQQTGPNQKDRY